MSNLALYQLTGQLLELQNLADEIPEDALIATLDGLEGQITEKSANVGLFVRNLEVSADAIEKASDELRERAKRLRNRSDSVRQYLKHHMELANITKIESPYVRLSIRKNPKSVEILDESAIPAEFMVTPPPPPPPLPRPDKRAILAAAEAGQTIQGIDIKQATRLEIK